MDVRLFPDDYDNFAALLETDAILVCSGQVSFDDYSGGNTMTARDIMTIANARENYVTSLDINIDRALISDNFIEQFTQIITPHKEGTCPIKVFYQCKQARGMLELGVQWRVSPADVLLYDLKELLGEESITLQFK